VTPPGAIGTTVGAEARIRGGQDVTLLDLLDRLLQGGIVIQGDITLAAADIDLVSLSLRVAVGAVESMGRDLRGPISREALPS
jgi:hypothetical protein